MTEKHAVGAGLRHADQRVDRPLVERPHEFTLPSPVRGSLGLLPLLRWPFDALPVRGHGEVRGVEAAEVGRRIDAEDLVDCGLLVLLVEPAEKIVCP